MKFIDRTNQRFGKLVVVEEAGRTTPWRDAMNVSKRHIILRDSLDEYLDSQRRRS